MSTLSLVLVILAIVFFILASAGVNHPRAHLGWLGLACLALSTLVGVLVG